MKKKISRRSFLEASGILAASAALTACGSNSAATETPAESSRAEHEALTMTAMVPFRNPSNLRKLVQEKYPEINIQFIPYSGYNATAFVQAQLAAGDAPDIYLGSMYVPSKMDMSDKLMDLASYSFTDNFTDQRLRDVVVDGQIYMLPLTYSCNVITYNKSLLERNGWELPNSLVELEALAPKVEAAGYKMGLSLIQFPGAGFQYFFNILSTGYVNTTEGRKWQNSFLAEETTFEEVPELMEDIQELERWRKIGMLNFDGDPDSDTKTREMMGEGNTLFLIGAAGGFAAEGSTDEFAYMPFLSKDGTSNAYIANVTKYIGLNKRLEEPGNEQKMEDALHVMEILCTVDGMYSLSADKSGDMLLPLRDFVIPEDSYYKPIEKALNEGYVAPYIYGGWENLAVPVGEKMLSFMRGDCNIEDVAKELDADQHLLSDNSDRVYTTVTEKLDVEDCAKLVGICFAKASGADAALVSTNKWFDSDENIAMNTRGVQCPLYAMPITDQEITAMLPTGWTGTIQTVTLTGARIKELAETGYDKFEDGVRLFPYSLIMPEGFALNDEQTYTVAICGASKAVQEEGDIQDTGIVGLTAAEEYLSQFAALTPEEIVWD